jgi:hypothetical protein
MANTKKTKATTEVEDSKEVKTNKTISDSSTINALQRQLEKAMAQIETLTKLQSTSTDDKLDSDELIAVISQCPNTLVLSTDGAGVGTIYQFDDFGEIQDIPFGDLRSIVKNNKGFVKQGLFYIANESAVKQLRLKSLYTKLLSNEDVLHLLDEDNKTIIDLYKLAPVEQQKSIIDMISMAVKDGKKIDTTVLVELGKLSGKELIKLEPEE